MAKSNGKPAAKSTSQFFPQKLYQRMSDDLHLTGKAERTQNGYLREIRKLAEYCRRSPDKITEDQVRLEGPLKELGLYTVRIQLHSSVDAELKVWVVPSVGDKEAPKDA